MTEPRLTLLGAGRMGTTLAAGWLRAGWSGRIDIIAPRPSDTVRAWAAAGEITLNPPPAPADILVLAVKPQVATGLGDEMRRLVGPHTRVISVMAALTLAQLTDLLGTARVARALPNTPGLIGHGMTPYCLPDAAPAGFADDVEALLAPLGAVDGPLSEAELRAAGLIAGSGPAYVFALTEAMADAGSAAGLAPERAMRLARAAVEGAGALMAASPDSSPATLRTNVTSPGGLTAAALNVLSEDGDLPGLMTRAVAAGIARDRALSEDRE